MRLIYLTNGTLLQGSAVKWNKLVPPSTPRRRAKSSARQSDLLRRPGKHDRRQHSGHASLRARSSSDNSAPSYASMAPLPATQLFLSKLKRKRPRVVSTELHYGKPAWVTINHIGLFFHAATQFERHYAHSLHVRARVCLDLHCSCSRILVPLDLATV